MQYTQEYINIYIYIRDISHNIRKKKKHFIDIAALIENTHNIALKQLIKTILMFD